MNNVVHNWSWVYWRWSAFCGWWGETSGNYGTCPCDWSMILLMMCTNPLLPKRDTFRWMSLVSNFAHYFNLAWCAYIYVCLLHMWGGRWFWPVSRPLLDFLDVWEVWRGWCWVGPFDDVGLTSWIVSFWCLSITLLPSVRHTLVCTTWVIVSTLMVFYLIGVMLRVVVNLTLVHWWTIWHIVYQKVNYRQCLVNKSTIFPCIVAAYGSMVLNAVFMKAVNKIL